MKKYSACLPPLSLLLATLSILAQTTPTARSSKPIVLQVPGAPIPTRVLVQSPSETVTELQIVCLFESQPQNTLRGSLADINQKLHGLLDQIRQPALFRGDLGETLVIEPHAGTIRAQKLLLVGLGDSSTFTPQRMELVGSILYHESHRLRIAHPYFAPTVLDGGITKFTTGEVAESFIAGFLRASRTEALLNNMPVSQGRFPQDLTYLAGPTHAADTQQGIERAVEAARP